MDNARQHSHLGMCATNLLLIDEAATSLKQEVAKFQRLMNWHISSTRYQYCCNFDRNSVSLLHGPSRARAVSCTLVFSSRSIL